MFLFRLIGVFSLNQACFFKMIFQVREPVEEFNGVEVLTDAFVHGVRGPGPVPLARDVERRVRVVRAVALELSVRAAGVPVQIHCLLICSVLTFQVI